MVCREWIQNFFNLSIIVGLELTQWKCIAVDSVQTKRNRVFCFFSQCINWCMELIALGWYQQPLTLMTLTGQLDKCLEVGISHDGSTAPLHLDSVCFWILVGQWWTRVVAFIPCLCIFPGASSWLYHVKNDARPDGLIGVMHQDGSYIQSLQLGAGI